MADVLDQLLTLNIVAQTAGITRRGFGTPLIAAYHTVFPERARVYTDPADMITDGFTAGSAAYRAAQAIMSQVPAPPSFIVGRLEETPNAHVETLTPTVVEGATYTLELADADGVAAEYEYTAGVGDTPTDICDAFRTAIGAGGQDVTPSGTATLVLTGDNAGEVFALAASDDANGQLWARANSTADPGMATDLAAIKAYNDSWFGLIVDNQSPAIINATAAWAETNRKLFGFTTSEDDAKNGAAGGGDVLDAQATASRAFAFGLYSERPHEYSAAALMGRIFPLDPGKASWAYKTLGNVTASRLTATQRANIEAKNGNWYLSGAGRAITFDGKTGLDYIDSTRTIEWLRARVQEAWFLYIANADKVPYTDKGIGGFEAVLRAIWAEGVANEALNDDLEVTVPLAANVSAGDKTARQLTGFKFKGTVQGAIHTLAVTGTISSAAAA
ncbi:MAG TPA: DUF3383 family protein [Thermoanaerobaculia bacterium]|nr:DUF3383 family protein [Thermoanaerobaculia bacterium]